MANILKAHAGARANRSTGGDIVLVICLFFLAAVALYFAAMGAYIGRFVFVGQTVIALVLGAAAITAVVLELKGKTEKTALISRLAVSASVVLAVLNAAC